MNDQGLITFFYLLMRNELPTGKIASIVKEIEAMPDGDEIVFTNKHLEAYAREIVDRLKAK